jgi:hypothetical protein
MRPTIKVPRLRNYKIHVTWIDGRYTNFKMMFFNQADAIMYALDKYGLGPKIKAEKA